MSNNYFKSEEPIRVEATRSGRREAIHSVHVALSDSDGSLLGHFGDPNYETYERSMAKPLQLLTVIGLRPSMLDECSLEEIALMSASHNGEAGHIEALNGLLERYNIAEECLTCGFHYPFVPEAICELGRDGIELSPVFHNCSGKHISMILACMAQGWPVEGYQMPGHPLQQANTRTMERYAGRGGGKIPYGVDGCGVPTWWISIYSIAKIAARYGNPQFGENDLEKKIRERIFDAYHKAAWYTAGTTRFGTPFNYESDGKWLGKIGGEGVYGVSFRNVGLGIGLKVMDGNSRAIAPALLYAMKKWGLISDDQLGRLSDWARKLRQNSPMQDIGWEQVVE